MLQLWTCNQAISDNKKAFNWPLRHRNGEESFERKLKAENIPVAFKTPFYFSWWSLHLILFGVSPRKKEDVGWRINLKLGFTFFINLTIYFRSFRFFHLYWSFALFAGTVYPLHLVRFVDRLLWKHDKTRYRLGKGVQKCVQVIQTQRVSPSDRAGKQNSVATMVCCKL